MEKKLSVVISIFDVNEKTEITLQNLFKEDYNENIKFILVNLSSEILKYKNNERVSIINNCSETDYMQKCLEKTDCNYITYLNQYFDIKSETMEMIYNEITNDDLIIFNSLNKNNNLKLFENITKEELKEKIFSLNTSFLSIIFNKRFLERNDIKFLDNLGLNFTLFTFESILKAEKISFKKDILLNYCNDGILDSLKYKSLLLNFYLLKEFLIKNNLMETYQYDFYNLTLENIFMNFDKLSMKNKEILLNYTQNFLNNYISQDERIHINQKMFKKLIKFSDILKYDELESTEKEIKVSVILPVYNSEQYLENCLQSIINQNLNEIEIICIDNNSMDRSLEILEAYAKKDSRIIVLKNDINRGPGYSRNRGIKMAKGEYITFVDSDDWLKAEIYEELYNEAKNYNLDLVMFPFLTYNDSTDEYYQEEYYSLNVIRPIVKNNIFNVSDLSTDKIFRIAVNPFNKLYKNNFVKRYNINFPEDIRFGEDDLFFQKIFFYANKVKIYPRKLYYRRRHPNSIMGAKGKNYIYVMEMTTEAISMFKEMGAFEEYKYDLFRWKFRTCKGQFNSIGEEYKKLFYETLHNDLINIQKDKELFEVFKSSLSKYELIQFNNLIKYETLNEYKLNEHNKQLISENSNLKKEIHNLKNNFKN